MNDNGDAMIADLQAQIVALRLAVEGAWLSILQPDPDPAAAAKRLGRLSRKTSSRQPRPVRSSPTSAGAGAAATMSPPAPAESRKRRLITELPVLSLCFRAAARQCVPGRHPARRAPRRRRGRTA